ncbi:hypothetical protein D3C76_1297870 [compost metagenome]
MLAIQFGNRQAAGDKALAQSVQLARNQPHGGRVFSPQLAGEAATHQLRLHLQRAQRVHVKRQFDAPELFLAIAFLCALLGVLLWSLLALQLDLQRNEFVLAAHRDFQLPSGLQVAFGRAAVLRQAGQLMGLQARDGRAGLLEQVLQVLFVFLGLQQP